MQLPPVFIANIRDVYGLVGDAWLAELPAQIQYLATKWNFQFIRPVPNLSYSFVGLVSMCTPAKTAILKIAPETSNIDVEIRWLNSFQKCVPKIYACEEKSQALLMEYLEPGNTLKDLVKAGNDDQATKIICQTIRDLQSQKHKECHFKHLSELLPSLSLLQGHFDVRLLSQAKSWFRDLTSENTQAVILHGDLHHDNILANGSNWKVIDPHGYCGDPGFEVGAMIYNPLDCFPKDKPLTKTVARRLQIMADELPFDAKRIKAWAFCMTILSIAWTFEEQKKIPKHKTAVAFTIDKVKI